MRQLFGLILLAPVLSLITACELGKEWQSEIHLPEGDATKGEALFATLGCVSCHAIGDADFGAAAEAGAVRVRLGSTAGRRMSYGQLVTA
ncbi:MAG: hypothetical protein AAGG11_11315, partial [Pseudomonadota bacterium]